MSAALIVGNGVDLVNDDGANAAQVLARLACGQQQVQRLGVVTRMCGGLRNMRARSMGRVSPVRTPVRISGQRRPRANASCGSRAAAAPGSSARRWRAPSAARRDNLGSRREVSRNGEAEQAVDGNQKRCQRLA